MVTPRPGDFGLVQVPGIIGWFISLGQLLAGLPARYQHAFIVLDDGDLLEAQPGGARIVPLAYWTRERGRHGLAFSESSLTDEQRSTLVEEAKKLRGTPYSFLDYLSIALLHWGIRHRWVTGRVASSGHLICSQLVDLVYQRAGLPLFKKEFPGDVMPSTLTYLDLDWIHVRHYPVDGE